jgi:hypothetical protein
MVMAIDPLEAVGDDADPADVARFDFLLADALERVDLRLYLVTAEHVGADAGLRELLPRLSECTDFHAHAYRLGGLRSQAWRGVIEGPAALAGVPWPPALAARVLDDVEALTVGPAPANWALATLCAARRQTVDDYEALGGVLHGAERAADRLVAALPEDNQRAVRTLLCALVRRRGGLDRPGRLSWATAQALLGGGEIEGLVKMMSRGRAEEGAPPLSLVRVEGSDDERGLALSHGALMDLWPSLRSWLSADRAVRARVETVTAACRAWADGGHSGDALPREARLAHLAGADLDPPARAAYRTRLNAAVRAFVEAGERAEASRRERAEAAANAERQAAYVEVVTALTRTRRRVRFFAVTALALTVLLAGLAVVTVRGQSQVFTLSDQLEALTRRHDMVQNKRADAERRYEAAKSHGKEAEKAQAAAQEAQAQAERARARAAGHADALLDVSAQLLTRIADAFARIPGNDAPYAHGQVTKWLEGELDGRTADPKADGRLRILAARNHGVLADRARARRSRRGVRSQLEAAVKTLAPVAQGDNRRDLRALARAQGALGRYLLERAEASAGASAALSAAGKPLHEAVALWGRVEALGAFAEDERHARLEVLTLRGRVHSLSGRHDAANQDLDAALAATAKRDVKSDVSTALQVAWVYAERGDAAVRARDYGKAKAVYGAGLKAIEPAVAAFPKKTGLFKLRRRLREGQQAVPR